MDKIRIEIDLGDEIGCRCVIKDGQGQLRAMLLTPHDNAVDALLDLRDLGEMVSLV